MAGTEVPQSAGSSTFEQLRALRASFDDLAAGRPRLRRVEQRTIQLVRELGPTGVALLGRMLLSDDENETSWAYFLLVALGGPRVESGVRGIVTDDRIGDDKRILALALLAELGAETPDEVTLKDPQAMCVRSVWELVESLEEPADVARAADVFLDQVGEEHLASFIDEVAHTVGAMASPLLQELLLRDDLPGALRPGFLGLLRRMPVNADQAVSDRKRRRSVWMGHAEDGRRAVLVTERHAKDSPSRIRAFLLEIGANGHLAMARYLTEQAPRKSRERLITLLEERGYAVTEGVHAEAAHWVAAAARELVRTQPLPRDFYLGRHMLDLHDEHSPWRLWGDRVLMADATPHKRPQQAQPKRPG